MRDAAIAFVWAVAEATLSPIMPDAVTVPLALHRPGGWWRLVIGAALGTMAGGVLSYLVGRRHPDRAAIERLPLIRHAMVAAADRWLQNEGPRGAWRQPATGAPFKVFARVAGAQRLPCVPFLLWAVAARSVRFVLLTGIAAQIGRRLPPDGGRIAWLLSAVWAVSFGLALWRLVRFWERRA